MNGLNQNIALKMCIDSLVAKAQGIATNFTNRASFFAVISIATLVSCYKILKRGEQK